MKLIDSDADLKYWIQRSSLSDGVSCLGHRYHGVAVYHWQRDRKGFQNMKSYWHLCTAGYLWIMRHPYGVDLWRPDLGHGKAARFWSYPFTLGYLQATYLNWFIFILVSNYSIYIDIGLYKNIWMSHGKWRLYRYFKMINLILSLIYICRWLLIYLYALLGRFSSNAHICNSLNRKWVRYIR